MNQSFTPDPTFHPTPKMAMEAPVETLAFTLMLSPDFSQPDGLAVVDVDPSSDTFGQILHTVMMPYKGDEFHHFGWNACSSALSPLTGHAFLERRYLVIPGIRSRSTRSSNPKKSLPRPAIRARIPSTAALRGSMSRHWAGAARTAPTAPRASSSSIAKPSKFSVAMRWIAASRTSTMISGGTCRAITWCRRNGACRRSSKTASWPRTC